MHPGLEDLAQFFLHLGQGRIFDGGGGGVAVPSAPQLGQDLGHIHFGQAAPPHHEDPVFHLGQGEEDLDVLHIHEAVGHHREIRHVFRGGGPGHDHLDAPHVEAGGVFQEVVEEGHLLGVQLPGDNLGDHVEVGPLAEEKAAGFKILGRGGRKGKGTRILENPQGHDGGLRGGQGEAPLPDDAGENGRGGADLLHDLQAAVHIFVGIRVVVVDVDVHQAGGGHFGKFADAGRLAGVHQDEAFDLIQGHLLHPGEIHEIKAGADEKVPEVALLGAGKDQERLGIELLGRHHGGHGVEIGVEVSGDHLQGAGRRRLVAVIAVIGGTHGRGCAFLCTCLRRSASRWV